MNDDRRRFCDCCRNPFAIKMPFQHGLCSCFDNCYICCCTYSCPCIVAGKVAESVGKSCLLHGIMYPFCPFISLFLQCFVREEIRKQKGIAGDQINDFCLHLCCTQCALCQEAMEMDGMKFSMAEQQSIERD